MKFKSSLFTPLLGFYYFIIRHFFKLSCEGTDLGYNKKDLSQNMELEVAHLVKAAGPGNLNLSLKTHTAEGEK